MTSIERLIADYEALQTRAGRWEEMRHWPVEEWEWRSVANDERLAIVPWRGRKHLIVTDARCVNCGGNVTNQGIKRGGVYCCKPCIRVCRVQTPFECSRLVPLGTRCWQHDHHLACRVEGCFGDGWRQADGTLHEYCIVHSPKSTITRQARSTLREPWPEKWTSTPYELPLLRMNVEDTADPYDWWPEDEEDVEDACEMIEQYIPVRQARHRRPSYRPTRIMPRLCPQGK